MKQYPHYVGIDIGTSNTSAAYWDSALNRVVPLRFPNDKYKLPSMVFISPNNELVFGEDAKNELIASSKYLDIEEKKDIQNRIIRSIKNKFMPDELILIPKWKPVKVFDILVEFIKYIKSCLELEIGMQVEKLVLSHPVKFSLTQKEMYKDTSLLAGFKEVSLVEEPVAAAINYRGIGQNVLVYDLGAGTFDIAYLNRDDETSLFKTNLVDGLLSCGGDLIDQIIYDFIDKKVIEKFKISIINEGQYNIEFLESCKSYKERCSRMQREKRDVQKFNDFLPPPINEQIEITISENQFNEFVNKVFYDTLTVISSVEKSIHDKELSIDTVLLVGGSSRFPQIKLALNEKFNNKVIELEDYDIAVAKGTVLFGEIYKKDETKSGNDIESTYLTCLEEFRINDDRHAFETLFNLASQGHTPSMLQIALAYLNGKVIIKNIAQGVRWLNVASDNGSIDAQIELANYYYEHLDIIGNDQKSYLLFKKASQTNSPSAFIGMGKCAYLGIGRERDFGEALDFFTQAKMHGDNNSQFEYIKLVLNNYLYGNIKAKFHPKIPSDILGKCISIYKEKIQEIIMIYGHFRSLGIPDDHGMVFDVNGIAWNNRSYPYNTNFVSWDTIDVNNIKELTNKSISFGPISGLTSLPVILDRESDVFVGNIIAIVKDIQNFLKNSP